MFIFGKRDRISLLFTVLATANFAKLVRVAYAVFVGSDKKAKKSSDTTTANTQQSVGGDQKFTYPYFKSLHDAKPSFDPNSASDGHSILSEEERRFIFASTVPLEPMVTIHDENYD